MLRILTLPVLFAATLLPASAALTRTVHASYVVTPGANVTLKLPGGSFDVEVVPGNEVDLKLDLKFKANDDTAADEMWAHFETVVDQTDGSLTYEIRRDKSKSGLFGLNHKWTNNVGIKAHVTVPAHLNLNLDTAGGSITVKGDIQGELDADTAGGSIQVGSATGHMRLDTAGGSIHAQRVYRSILADTAGGSITIDYVGPNAVDVNADTSGGSITIGLDAAGHYTVDADTSGGGVSVDHPGYVRSTEKKKRSSARGEINGGGARVRADTAGGGILIRVAQP